MAFDVAGALKAGYSPAEIADHLASQSSFDVDGARAAGYSDAEILQHLAGVGANKSAARPERSWSEAASDTAVQLAEGVNTLAGAVPNLVAPDSAASEFFNRNAEYWREKQSDPLKERIATAGEAIDAAGEDGVIAQVTEAASQYFSDPALAARFVTTNLPSMIPGIGAAKLAQAAALARGASAAKAASVATTAAGATNAGLNAGGARGDAFQDIKQTLMAQGLSEEEATDQALQDSRVSAAVGGLAGFVSGKIGLEGALVGRQTASGAARAFGGGLIKETAGEQLEEVSPQLTTNLMAGQYDDRSVTQNIGRTIVETAIGAGPGSILAGGADAVNASRQRKALAEQALQQAPDAASAAAAANELAGSVDELTSSVDAYLSPQAPIAQDSTAPAALGAPAAPSADVDLTPPDVMRLAQLRAMVDRQAELMAQADQAPTEFDRRMALEQAEVARPPARERAGAGYADLTPMDERQADVRLRVLSELQGQDPSTLAVVPHPAQEGAFAIARQTPRVEAAPAAPAAPDITPQEANTRLEAAAVAGLERPSAPRPSKIAGTPASTFSDEQLQEIASNESLPAISRRGASVELNYRQAEQASQAPAPEPTGIVPVESRARPPSMQDLVAARQQENELASVEMENRALADRARTERQTQEQIAQTSQPTAAPDAGAVIQAMTMPGSQRSAEQVSLVRQAEARYSSEDFSILQRAATAPFQLNAREKVRLRQLRNPVAPKQAPAVEAPTAPPLMGSRVAERLGLPTQGRVVTSDAKLSTQRPLAPGARSTLTDGDLEHEFTVVEPGRLGNPGRLLQQVARVFGKRLVVFESDTLQADGFVMNDDNRSVYINAKSQVSPLAVFGHELTHLLKRDNPQAYAALEAVVQQELKDGALAQFGQEYGDGASLEELASDLVGNRFQEADFWSSVFEEVASQNPEEARGIINRLAAALVRSINAFINVIRQPGYNADQYVRDLNNVKAAIKNAVAQYAQQQRGPAMAAEAETASGVPAPVSDSRANAAPAEVTFSRKRGETEPPATPRSSVDIMRDPDAFKARLGLNPGKNTTRQIGEALNRDTIERFGQIADNDTSEEARDKVANAIADEVRFQLGRPRSSGVGWYSKNFPKALRLLGRVYPELQRSPGARATFTAFLAITSNGEKVTRNVAMARQLYEAWRDNKDITSAVPGTKRQAALQGNIELINELLEQYGPNAMPKALLQELTVGEINRQLRAVGKSSQTDYPADMTLPRAALYFGAKLGAFYANLMGSHGYLTMDLWWSRSINRMRGTLLPQPSQGMIDFLRNAFAEPDASIERLVELARPYQESYIDKGYKDGTALEKRANTFMKAAVQELNETPFRASDRRFMAQAAEQAQQLLRQDGYDLTIADIQAALWYYEKRLYGALGSRVVGDIGYLEALENASESDRPQRPAARFGGEGSVGADAEGAREEDAGPVPAGDGPAGRGRTGDASERGSGAPAPEVTASRQRKAEDIPREELSGRSLRIPVLVEDTGQTATITMDAKTALDDIDEREDAMRRLLECLGK